MVRMKIITIAGIVLIMTLVVGIVSASTVSIGNAHVETAGESASVNLTLDQIAAGLTGYNVTVTVSDPGIATITGITFPPWASVTDNTTLPAATVSFAAADLNELIQDNMTDVWLGSVVLRGDNLGKTAVSVIVNILEDEQGNPITPSTQSGYFTVGSVANITAMAGVGGAIAPAGTIPVMIGDSATFTIIPDSCFAIGDVFVDSVSIGPVPDYTFTDVISDHTISVEFSRINFTISSMSGEGGIISPTGDQEVPCGTNQTFDITPNTGYAILDVIVDEVPAGALASYTFTNVSSNHTISAQFTPVSPGNFTILASAGDHGTIDPSGPVQVLPGADQSFLMTPDMGYTVMNVRVDAIAQGALTSYTFTNVTGNHTIVAEFAPVSPGNLTIVATAGLHGTIEPSGPVQVLPGADQSFIISPDTGYTVMNVVVDAIAQGALTSYTFTNVTGNHTIVAEFAPVSPGNFTIVATAGLHGTIEPSGPVQVLPGADQSFAIIPAPDYNISTVIVDDIAQGALASYTFTNVSGNHTISAFFSQGIEQGFSVTLDPGWNLFSTPIKLERYKNTVGEVFDNSSLEKIELIYGWDGNEWFIPAPTFEIKPLYALYVKARAPVTLTLTPSTEPSAPPLRELIHGFSLIGPAPAPQGDEFPIMPVNETFTTIEELPGGTVGYLVVISPTINQPGWVYHRGGEMLRDVIPFKGYWVFMDNSGTLGGFSTTPLR